MSLNVETFEIPHGKIVKYLLDVAHVEGGSKAKFFLGKGFRVEAPQELADALAVQALTNWPGSTSVGVYGMKHRIVAPLGCPDGSTPTIIAVWIVERSSRSARFVTAYPSR